MGVYLSFSSAIYLNCVIGDLDKPFLLAIEGESENGLDSDIP